MEIYNYLLIYLFLVSSTIIYSFIKERTHNDLQKFIRLLHFFLFIPAKIVFVLFLIAFVHYLLSKGFFMLFEKSNKNFPSFLLFLFDYGIYFILIVYSLFGQQIFSLFIIFFMITLLVSYSLTKSLGYTFFHYKIKNNSFWNWIGAFFWIIFMMLCIIPLAYIIVQIYMLDFSE